MKKYILLAITLLTSISMWAVDYVKHEGVTYKITDPDNHYVEVYQDSANVKKLSGSVVIPATFNAIPVGGTEAADYTVKGFGLWAYGNTINLDMSATSITEVDMYYLRTNVGELSLPESLDNLHYSNYSYGGPKYIASFKVPDANPKYSITEDGVIFNKDKTTLCYYPGRKKGAVYTVPSTVTVIRYDSFYDNDNLQKIVLPSILKEIGSHAFCSCDYLSDVNIPSSVTYIGPYAFNGCKLNPENNTLVLPGSLTEIKEHAFHDAFAFQNSTTVEFPSTLGLSGSAVKVYNYAFDCQIIRAKMNDPAVSEKYAFNYVTTIYVPKGAKSAYVSKTGWGYKDQVIANKIKESTTSTDNPTYERVDKPTITETISGTNMNLTFATTTKDATIRFKIGDANDNSDPVDWGLYDGEPKAITNGQTVRVVAMKDGMNDSEIVLKTYDFSSMKCGKPTINFNKTDTIITITKTDVNDVIYYTTDGSVPSKTNGKEYTVAIVPKANNVAYRAVAVREGWFNSDVSETVNTSTFFKCPVVAFDQVLEKGTAKMKLALSDTESVDISEMSIYCKVGNYYYNDEDWKNNGTIYTEPVPVDNNQTIYAVVMKEGYATSNMTYKSMNLSESGWKQLNSPTINLDDKNKIVSINAPDTVQVYYLIQPANSTVQLTPSTESTPYTGEFTSDVNGIVKAIAAKDGYVNSQVATKNLENWFQLANVLFEPQYDINGSTKSYSMRLSHAEDGVTIKYYVSDSYYYSEDATKKIYDDANPFAVSIGKYVWAQATLPGRVSSEWKYFAVTENSFKVQKPSVSSTNSTTKEIVVKTETPNATMYYYTVDAEGKVLTSGSKMASDTLKLSQNDNLRFYAMKDKMETSDTISYNVTDWFQLAQVTITPFVEDNKLKVRLSHSDPNAVIYYGIGNYNSTVTSNLPYSTPITVSDGDRVYASAVKDHFQPANWNYTSWLYYSNYTCDQPTISIDADTIVTIAHAEGATVYYTLDDTDPTTESTVYTAPFKLTRNANIKAFATQNDKMSSGIVSREYNRFYVRNISFSLDSVTLTISSSTPDAVIRYQYEAEGLENMTYPHVYTGPFELEYNGYVYVQGSKDGFNSSTTEYYPGNVVKCYVKEESYDGHILKLSTSPGATIWYTTDGQRPYDNTNEWYDNVYKYEDGIAIESTGSIKAIATSNYRNESSVFEKRITSYAGETGATTETPGQLAASMAWANPAKITEFKIEGDINAVDLQYIRDNMTSLTTLDLSKAKMDGEIPTNAFAGMPLVSYASPANVSAVGEGIFAGCKDLAAVEWNSSVQLPNSTFDDDVNPNLLLFLKYETSAPKSTTVKNLIVNGEATLITLVDDENSNFYSPREFKTKEISYTHNFEMTSGDGGGWESIALPFDVQRVFHESKGNLLPFTAWEAQGKPEEYKPFWLSEFTVDGFVDVSAIEANKPYIICMPNNDRYASRFRLGGKVTFYGANITVPVTNPISATRGNVTFTPNFQSRATEGDVLALNMEQYGEYAPGSIFVNDSRTIRPFEAYATSIGMSRALIRMADLGSRSGFGDTTGIVECELDDSDIVKVYNLSGMLIRQASKSDALQGLTKGVYIVNGKRIIVK